VTALGIALQIAGLGRDGRPSPENLLHKLATVTAYRLPGCCAASITLWDKGRVLRSSVSHADLVALRDLPRTSSSDPERQALARHQAVSIVDTRTSAEWGQFGMHATAFGIRSVVFEPLNAGVADATFGFYSTEPGAFDGADLALIAAESGTVVEEAEHYRELARSVHALRAGLDSRSIIDQAAGIIMAERSCSAEAALAELRRRSNHENLRLAEVARRLVSGQSPPRGERAVPG
jgi:hypothetical protein